MLKQIIISTVIAMPLCSVAALAQTDMTTMQRNAAGNQLGVLEYCQGRGDIDGTAVAGERRVVSMLPAGVPIDSAESAGKSGTILGANGTSYPISDMADKGHTTVSAMCKQMGSTVNASATNNPAMNMGGGGMPAMPNGAAMPAMPQGMTMPAMPGAPAAPAQP